MNNPKQKYLIGFTVRNLWPVWIGYCPQSYDNEEELSVCIGEGRVGFGAVKPPKEMLEFIYGQTISKEINGKVVIERRDEPPGWFERECREANCEWFIPLARRMAQGEKGLLEEVKAAYLAHNGKPIYSCSIECNFPWQHGKE